MCKGRMLADVVAVVGSIDIVLGEIDRKEEVPMVDYVTLAKIAKAKLDADNLHEIRQKEAGKESIVFFRRVKEHVFAEMNKANVELRKQGADTIARYNLPHFDKDIFLTYGTHLLCQVKLDAQAATYVLSAVIFGPPNRCQVSCKKYSFSGETSNLRLIDAEDEESPTVETQPEEIAEDIIASIITGKFN